MSEKELYSDDNQSVQNDLEKISARLADNAPDKHALFLSENDFKTVYTFFIRFMARFDITACRIMFKLKPSAEDLSPEGFDKLVESFGKNAVLILRKSDMIMQPKKNEFLLLLPGVKEKKADVIIRRILDTFDKIPGSEKVSIVVIFEIVTPDDSNPNDLGE